MAFNNNNEFDPSCGTTDSSTRFKSNIHFVPHVGSSPQSDAEKLIADTRRRIQQRQLQIVLSLEEVKNDFKTSVAEAKARWSNLFLGEHFFKDIMNQQMEIECSMQNQFQMKTVTSKNKGQINKGKNVILDKNENSEAQPEDHNEKETEELDKAEQISKPRFEHSNDRKKREDYRITEFKPIPKKSRSTSPKAFEEPEKLEQLQYVMSTPEDSRTPEILAARAIESALEINVQITSPFKLPQNQRFIVIVDDLTYDGIEESFSTPRTIVQPKQKSIDSSTSPYIDSSSFSKNRSICKLATDSDSSSSSYESCISDDEINSMSLDFDEDYIQPQQIVNPAPLSFRLRDDFKDTNKSITKTTRPPSALQKKTKKDLRVTYEKESEMNANCVTAPAKKQDSSVFSLYKFLRPVCGLIFEMENDAF